MTAENPVLIDLNADVWTLVAGGVTNGLIDILKAHANAVFFQTTRITEIPIADPPDAELIPDDPLFEGTVIYYRIDRIAGENVPVGSAAIRSTVPRDIYVYAWKNASKIKFTRGA